MELVTTLPPRKIDSVNHTCRTCLAKNRKSYKLDAVYINLLYKLEIFNKKSNDWIQSVCWECHAKLRNIHKFSEMALRAKYLTQESPALVSYACMSSLKTTQVVRTPISPKHNKVSKLQLMKKPQGQSIKENLLKQDSPPGPPETQPLQVLNVKVNEDDIIEKLKHATKPVYFVINKTNNIEQEKHKSIVDADRDRIIDATVANSTNINSKEETNNEVSKGNNKELKKITGQEKHASIDGIKSVVLTNVENKSQTNYENSKGNRKVLKRNTKQEKQTSNVDFDKFNHIIDLTEPSEAKCANVDNILQTDDTAKVNSKVSKKRTEQEKLFSFEVKNQILIINASSSEAFSTDVDNNVQNNEDILKGNYNFVKVSAEKEKQTSNVGLNNLTCITDTAETVTISTNIDRQLETNDQSPKGNNREVMKNTEQEKQKSTVDLNNLSLIIDATKTVAISTNVDGKVKTNDETPKICNKELNKNTEQEKQISAVDQNNITCKINATETVAISTNVDEKVQNNNETPNECNKELKNKTEQEKRTSTLDLNNLTCMIEASETGAIQSNVDEKAQINDETSKENNEELKKNVNQEKKSSTVDINDLTCITDSTETVAISTNVDDKVQTNDDTPKECNKELKNKTEQERQICTVDLNNITCKIDATATVASFTNIDGKVLTNDETPKGIKRELKNKTEQEKRTSTLDLNNLTCIIDASETVAIQSNVDKKAPTNDETSKENNEELKKNDNQVKETYTMDINDLTCITDSTETVAISTNVGVKVQTNDQTPKECNKELKNKTEQERQISTVDLNNITCKIDATETVVSFTNTDGKVITTDETSKGNKIELKKNGNQEKETSTVDLNNLTCKTDATETAAISTNEDGKVLTYEETPKENNKEVKKNTEQEIQTSTVDPNNLTFIIDSTEAVAISTTVDDKVLTNDDTSKNNNKQFNINTEKQIQPTIVDIDNLTCTVDDTETAVIPTNVDCNVQTNNKTSKINGKVLKKNFKGMRKLSKKKVIDCIVIDSDSFQDDDDRTNTLVKMLHMSDDDNADNDKSSIIHLDDTDDDSGIVKKNFTKHHNINLSCNVKASDDIKIKTKDDFEECLNNLMETNFTQKVTENIKTHADQKAHVGNVGVSSEEIKVSYTINRNNCYEQSEHVNNIQKGDISIGSKSNFENDENQIQMCDESYGTKKPEKVLLIIDFSKVWKVIEDGKNIEDYQITTDEVKKQNKDYQKMNDCDIIKKSEVASSILSAHVDKNTQFMIDKVYKKTKNSSKCTYENKSEENLKINTENKSEKINKYVTAPPEPYDIIKNSLLPKCLKGNGEDYSNIETKNEIQKQNNCSKLIIPDNSFKTNDNDNDIFHGVSEIFDEVVDSANINNDKLLHHDRVNGTIELGISQEWLVQASKTSQEELSDIAKIDSKISPIISILPDCDPVTTKFKSTKLSCFPNSVDCKEVDNENNCNADVTLNVDEIITTVNVDTNNLTLYCNEKLIESEHCDTNTTQKIQNKVMQQMVINRIVSGTPNELISSKTEVFFPTTDIEYQKRKKILPLIPKLINSKPELSSLHETVSKQLYPKTELRLPKLRKIMPKLSNLEDGIVTAKAQILTTQTDQPKSAEERNLRRIWPKPLTSLLNAQNIVTQNCASMLSKTVVDDLNNLVDVYNIFLDHNYIIDGDRMTNELKKMIDLKSSECKKDGFSKSDSKSKNTDKPNAKRRRKRRRRRFTHPKYKGKKNSNCKDSNIATVNKRKRNANIGKKKTNAVGSEMPTINLKEFFPDTSLQNTEICVKKEYNVFNNDEYDYYNMQPSENAQYLLNYDIDLGEMKIKTESVDSDSTDTATEFNELDDVNYENPYVGNNVPFENDHDTTSFPSILSICLPNPNQSTAEDEFDENALSAKVNDSNFGSANLEFDECPTIEPAEEQINTIISNLDTDIESQETCIPSDNLLEPVSFETWKDETYHHVTRKVKKKSHKRKYNKIECPESEIDKKQEKTETKRQKTREVSEPVKNNDVSCMSSSFKINNKSKSSKALDIKREIALEIAPQIRSNQPITLINKTPQINNSVDPKASGGYLKIYLDHIKYAEKFSLHKNVTDKTYSNDIKRCNSNKINAFIENTQKVTIDDIQNPSLGKLNRTFQNTSSLKVADEKNCQDKMTAKKIILGAQNEAVIENEQLNTRISYVKGKCVIDLNKNPLTTVIDKSNCETSNKLDTNEPIDVNKTALTDFIKNTQEITFDDIESDLTDEDMPLSETRANGPKKQNLDNKVTSEESKSVPVKIKSVIEKQLQPQPNLEKLLLLPVVKLEKIRFHQT